MGDKIHPAPAEFTAAQIEADPILRYFHYGHLPEPLRSISESFCTLAAFLVTAVPRNAERSVALRKLLEAKDAGVRANVATPIPSTYKTRLVDEYRELSAKMDKLRAFIGTDPFNQLSTNERADLEEQYQFMEAYRGTLERRINRSNLGPLADGEVQIRNGDQTETPIPFD
jgi:hypothetical protein